MQPNTSAGRVIPQDIAFLLGEPPLLRGENREAYDQLLARIVTWVDPQDIFEWISAKDYADYTWEIGRLKTIIPQIVNSGQKKALAELYLSLSDKPDGDKDAADAVASWYKNDDKKYAVTRVLAHYGFDEQSVVALAFAQKIQVIEKLDRLLARAEAQRRAVLRDLELHRQSSLWERKRMAPKLLEGEAEKIPLVPQGG